MDGFGGGNESGFGEEPGVSGPEEPHLGGDLDHGERDLRVAVQDEDLPAAYGQLRQEVLDVLDLEVLSEDDGLEAAKVAVLPHCLEPLQEAVVEGPLLDQHGGVRHVELPDDVSQSCSF